MSKDPSKAASETAQPEPDIWGLMMVDPSVPIDRTTLRLVIRDQRRVSRKYVYPWLRIVSRVTVTCIVVGKRVLPFQFRAHATMDRLCLWFLRRFVAPDAVSLLIRHFIVETNLLNFALRNAQVPGSIEVELRPTALAGLGNRAVVEHDLNVYRVLHRLGASGRSLEQHHLAELDFGMLVVPATDPEPRTRRLVRLDIQSALCLMNIPFSLCLTSSEYRRAVHSMSLDTSLLAVLATLTGDHTFLDWRSGVQPLRVDSNIDVPLTVYEHAVLCEYAHARLRELAHSVSSSPLLMA
ncbi:DUF6999 family protein [Actinospica sp.]|jgi:hypothetical protein|uniref:DUF6999 family protein n=1 Tax=Actinospica sp. TaxID=1872142 RepID=UPI002CBF0F87|nr:hypothetical protein [Actinospica sp.]HWG26299.1 hypothetical protein [Actinospica sp.]